jgi:DNA transposition AAA+ family ATPase
LKTCQEAVSRAEGKPVSDAAFAERFLPVSASTLSRLRDGTYNGGNMARMTERLEEALAEMDSRVANIERGAALASGFVRTTFAKAVLASVTRARDSRRRVVVALSGTGAGKTEIGRHLERGGAVYVEGRKCWTRSYKAFCADVAAAAGRRMQGRAYTEQEAEQRMLSALSGRSGVLYIDEANALGNATVDAIKLIVNQTGYVVVVAAIPNAWDALAARAEDEVWQLVNRCQPVLRYSGVTADDARVFLAPVVTGDLGALAEAAKLAAEAATHFGAFATVLHIRDALRDLDKPGLDDVKKIISTHERSLAAARVGFRGDNGKRSV